MFFQKPLNFCKQVTHFISCPFMMSYQVSHRAIRTSDPGLSSYAYDTSQKCPVIVPANIGLEMKGEWS